MPLRPESSVSLDIDDFGELVFAGDRPGPVIHRTAAELGIEAVFREEAAGKLSYVPDPDWRRGTAKKKAPARKRERLAKPIERPAPVVTMKEEKAMSKGKFGFRTPEDVRAKILAEPLSLSHTAVGEKHGVSSNTVWLMRRQAGLKSTAKPTGRKPGAAKPEKVAKPAASRMIPVEIDPGREGNASSMLSALARIDAANERVKIEIELTHAEVALVLGGLSDRQRQAFLNAGMRAALFA